MLGGLLDYADFWIVEGWGSSNELNPEEFTGPMHAAHYRILNPIDNYEWLPRGCSGVGCWRLPDRKAVQATWRGSLIGIGHNKAYENLYRQVLAGDVEIATTVETEIDRFLGREDEYDKVALDIEISNIKKVNTGEAVTLSTQEWQFVADLSSVPIHGEWPIYTSSRSVSEEGTFGGIGGSHIPGVQIGFGGPDYDTVVGTFVTDEALGAFGAKKEE